MKLLIFGLGYSAGFIAAAARRCGWDVAGTTRDGRGGSLCFGDRAAVAAALARADAVLSSVPPDESGGDPVLACYGAALGGRRLAYLSSTGVYGDAGGAWVDESAPILGRRPGRNAADAAWLDRGAAVLRLPGIYGPGRSALDRVAAGAAHRIDLPGQVFSRIHVEDLAQGALAALAGPAGAYNLADDLPCSQNEVIEFACRLLGAAPPPLQTMAEAKLSPMARAFYAENRRVANGKARRLLGWRPRYRDYRLGLRALSAITSPASASSAPPAASHDQR